jgi:hypothetical protein
VRVDADRKAEEDLKAEAEAAEATEEEKTLEKPTISKEKPDENAELEKIDKPLIKPDSLQTPFIMPVVSAKKDSLNFNSKSPVTEEEEDERPKAKGMNIFQKLFKSVKETKEFQQIEEGLQSAKDLAKTASELAAEDETPADSLAEKKTLQRVEGELTLEQIQEIRRREAEEKASRDSVVVISKEDAEKAAKELKKQKEKEREQIRKDKAKENKERLAKKAKERKIKEAEAKQRLKQKKKERREKEKAQKAAKKAAARNKSKK